MSPCSSWCEQSIDAFVQRIGVILTVLHNLCESRGPMRPWDPAIWLKCHALLPKQVGTTFLFSFYMQTTNHSPSASTSGGRKYEGSLKTPASWAETLRHRTPKNIRYIFIYAASNVFTSSLFVCPSLGGVWRGRNMGWRFLTVHIDKMELIPQPLAGRRNRN